MIKLINMEKLNQQSATSLSTDTQREEEFDITHLKEVAAGATEELFKLYKDKKGKLILTETQFNIVKKLYKFSQRD